MNATVKVTAKDGQVVIASVNNPEYGYIRVEQSSMTFKNGWASEESRSALIKGKVESLNKLGFTEGKVIGGKIVVKESLTPFRPGQEPKRAGKDGEILTHNGSPIYRESFYTDDMSAQDILIAHDTATVSAGSDIQA